MIPSYIKIKILSLRRINAKLGSKGLSKLAAFTSHQYNIFIKIKTLQRKEGGRRMNKYA